MLRKKVYVNDRVIGEAQTWNEVDALLESKSIRFLNKSGVAEGPTAFYISAAYAQRDTSGSRKADEIR